MQRDKRGRFVKKAQSGMTFTLDGVQYKVKPEANQAFTKQSKYKDMNEWLATLEGQSYLERVTPGTGSLNNPMTPKFTAAPKLEVPNMNDPLGIEHRKSLQYHDTISGGTGYLSDLAPEKITYTTGKDGKMRDEYGNVISSFDLMRNPNWYQSGDIRAATSIPTPDVTEEKEDSNGMNLSQTTGDKLGQGLGKAVTSINKTKLADYLEYARAGIAAGVNNKIAERALKAEKPFLQDVSESHRSIYGDYRSQVQGEKAAAQLRNMASKPLTSDGALQQQMMMEAQIKGQEYIDQGNAKDEAMIKQTREVAWQQEKENQQQRQAAAMQNRQAMLMSQKNKTNILNTRDSANFSQVVSPLLAAKEQRLRSEGAQQEYYQDYYDDALVSNEVWNTFEDGLTDSQKILKNKYLTEGVEGLNTYIGTDSVKKGDWMQLQRIIQNEIIRRKAAVKGVSINPSILNTSSLNSTSSYYEGTPIPWEKKGGTVYKARLSKRVRDKDRGARSIESSKKIAARFLEKAIDSLYDYNDVELIAKPKNKKRKYQSGGGLPYVGFTPVFAASEAGAPKTTTKDTKEDKGEDLTTKDVLALLKDMDGLPSDMQVIVSTLKNFEMSDKMDPLGLSTSSDIASKYIKLINQIKVAKFNRDEYNQAFNQLKGNGGLHELAVTSEGMLVGTNQEGDFEYFSPEEASKGAHTEKGYSLLTNSNLLYLRANSLDAAFNHKLTTFAQNGIGIETVNKLINDAIANLGSMQDSQEGYVKTKNGELIKGLQEFYNAMEASGGKFDGTINDLYKYKYLTKSQAEQAKKAMQYVYQTLPENAKSLLKVKSDGSDAGAIKLIETIISSKESTNAELDIDLVGGKTYNKSGAGSTAKDNSDLKTSLPLNVLKDIGGVQSYIDVDRGDGIHMSVRGTQYNLIKTPSGESIYDTSLADMLNKSGLQGIIKDMRSIQFGDQKISPEALSNITYNNTGITRANLPIKPDGTVNLELLESYEQAEREIDLSNDKSPENIKQVYEKYGLLDLLNADGSYKQSKFAPFMVTEGYTTDTLSGLKDSEFVKEYKGDDDAAVKLMQRSLAVGTGNKAQVPEIDTFGWYNPADWFGWTDTIYKGVIYIPITNNVNTAVLGANQFLDYDEALLQEEKYQNFEKMSNQKSTDADILNI